MEQKKKFIICFLYALVIVTIVFLAIKYLLGPLSPFIIAFLIVSVSGEAINKLTFGVFSKKTASIIFTFLLVISIAVILYLLLYGLITETIRLHGTITDSNIIGNISHRFNDYFSGLDKNSLIYKGYSMISGYLSDDSSLVKKLTEEYIPKLISFLFKFLSHIPSALLFIFVLFISLFYIGYDYDMIYDFLILQLPEKALDTLTETKSILFSTVKELFRAYFLLTFITFTQLLIGFLILKIEYAFILASIICFVDLLPILGTGTVLFPWALICFLSGDLKRAVGLLVLYAVITIFRQVAEPKIVGANIGLSPLLSLISIFAGFKLMGFGGLILFHIIVITIIRLNEKKLIRVYKSFPKASDDIIKKTKRKYLDFKKSEK